jgi:hypothetical protein
MSSGKHVLKFTCDRCGGVDEHPCDQFGRPRCRDLPDGWRHIYVGTGNRSLGANGDVCAGCWAAIRPTLLAWVDDALPGKAYDRDEATDATD